MGPWSWGAGVMYKPLPYTVLRRMHTFFLRIGNMECAQSVVDAVVVYRLFAIVFIYLFIFFFCCMCIYVEKYGLNGARLAALI